MELDAMTLVDVMLGLIVVGAALYSGFFAAARVTPLLDGLYRIHPVVRYLFQANIGVLAGLLVGIALTVARIDIGLIPAGADPDFPGSILGISTTAWFLMALGCHLFIAFAAKVLVRRSPQA